MAVMNHLPRLMSLSYLTYTITLHSCLRKSRGTCSTCMHTHASFFFLFLMTYNEEVLRLELMVTWQSEINVELLFTLKSNSLTVIHTILSCWFSNTFNLLQFYIYICVPADKSCDYNYIMDHNYCGWDNDRKFKSNYDILWSCDEFWEILAHNRHDGIIQTDDYFHI